MGNLQFCDWCKHDRGDDYNSVKAYGGLSEAIDKEKYDILCDKCIKQYWIFRASQISSVIPQICYKEQDDG